MEGKGLPGRSKGGTTPAPHVCSDKPRWGERCRAAWKLHTEAHAHLAAGFCKKLRVCLWLASPRTGAHPSSLRSASVESVAGGHLVKTWAVSLDGSALPSWAASAFTNTGQAGWEWGSTSFDLEKIEESACRCRKSW